MISIFLPSDRDPWGGQIQGASGPSEKDLGRHRLSIGFRCPKTKKNLIFID
jgi:hypothetical protein